MTECPEKPELLFGAPIGMYHCPKCGCMVLAGLFPRWISYRALLAKNQELRWHSRKVHRMTSDTPAATERLRERLKTMTLSEIVAELQKRDEEKARLVEVLDSAVSFIEAAMVLNAFEEIQQRAAQLLEDSEP